MITHRLSVFHLSIHGRQSRGSSLLLVLWAIMLMSFSIIGLVNHLSTGLDESITAEKRFRARLLLQSAVVLAAHPAMERGDPLLRQHVSQVLSYDILLTNEGDHIAINQLAASVPQRQFAVRLFQKWGMDIKQAQTLADSIVDWIDADDRALAQGAERDYYTTLGRSDFPQNRPFDNIDDLILVRGFSDIERLQPDWRHYFTLFGDGTIDVHMASAELLAVLFDVTTTEVQRFISARLGPDGLVDTIDDLRFTTLREIRHFLDVPRRNFFAVFTILTLDHPIKRTECIARAGNLERRLTTIKGPGINLIREE